MFTMTFWILWMMNRSIPVLSNVCVEKSCNLCIVAKVPYILSVFSPSIYSNAFCVTRFFICSLFFFHIHFVHSLIHLFIQSFIQFYFYFLPFKMFFSLICLSKAKQIRFRPKIFIFWGLMTKQSKHFLFTPFLIPLWTKHSPNFLLP